MSAVGSIVGGMTEAISEADFSATVGLEDCRVLFLGAKTLYEIGDFESHGWAPRRAVDNVAADNRGIFERMIPLVCNSRKNAGG